VKGQRCIVKSESFIENTFKLTCSIVKEYKLFLTVNISPYPGAKSICSLGGLLFAAQGRVGEHVLQRINIPAETQCAQYIILPSLGTQQIIYGYGHLPRYRKS
jgi:hypothetical protein